MIEGIFTPQARRELEAAIDWIADDNPDAAEGLLRAALQAATMIAVKPMLARIRTDLAPSRYRFWSLRGYPYLLIFDTDMDPSVVARFVHQARDLPALLNDLEQ